MNTTVLRICSAATGLAALLAVASGLPAAADTPAAHTTAPATPTVQMAQGPSAGYGAYDSAGSGLGYSLQVDDFVDGLDLTRIDGPVLGGLTLPVVVFGPGTGNAYLVGSSTESTWSAHYIGTRSASVPAMLQATYEVEPPPAGSDPTSLQAELAGTQIHIDAVMDPADPEAQDSTVTVTGPPAADGIVASIKEGGDVGGDAYVVVLVDPS